MRIIILQSQSIIIRRRAGDRSFGHSGPGPREAIASSTRPSFVTGACLYIRTPLRNARPDSFAVFDWGSWNRTHCRKHGVSITEIEELLRGNPRIAPDLKQAHLEDRLIAVGRTAEGRPLFVAFCSRSKFGRRTIRPVSARYMHAKKIPKCGAFPTPAISAKFWSRRRRRSQNGRDADLLALNSKNARG
jgi:uncharacterized DUF497 family protein